jgi:poly(3-hydroxybutyrate) depolymerase
MVSIDTDSHLSVRVVQPQPHQPQQRRIIDANGELVCGEKLHRQWTMPGVDCGKDCEREYVFYVPSSACRSPSEAQAEIAISLPLVFAIHCFGCTPKTMMHWVDVAETYQFVLAIPKGIRSSFNAQHCCGYALEQNVDDVGFLTGIITELSAQHSFISPEITYAIGWSNGGYMVMYAAHLFRAIAPISGFQVDPLMAPLERPTALFLHHAVDDRFVRINGCCTDSSMPKCCCDLSSFVDQCSSAQDKFREWSQQINRCQNNDDSMVQTTISNNDVTCMTTSGSGCQANTTFCTHQHGGHFNGGGGFSRAFPMTLEIAEFFARDACSIHGGTWSSSSSSLSSSSTINTSAISGRCACPPNRKGTYCLVGIEEKIVKQQEEDPIAKDDPTANGLGMFFLMGIFLVAGSMLFLVKSRLRKRRYHGFGKVSTVELPTMK